MQSAQPVGWVKWIFLGWLITQSLYLAYWMHSGTVFGKSDVQNYLRMPDNQLTGWSLRHTIIRWWQLIFPSWTFLLIIPMIYWWGLVLPTYILFGEDGAHVLVYGTASCGLCFILALWSQFFSMAALLWALVLRRHHKWLWGIPLLLSITYLPMLYFLVALYLPVSWLVVATGAAMAVMSENFWWNMEPLHWNPMWVFFVYVCPIVWIRHFFGRDRWPQKSVAKWYILTLTRLSRGLIFMFPWMRVELRRRDKMVLFAWWAFTMLIFMVSWMQDYGTGR